MQMFPFDGIDESLVAQLQRQPRRNGACARFHHPALPRSTERDDPFWRYCRDMEIPDSLAERIAVFREQRLCLAGRGRTVPVGLVDPCDARAGRRCRASIIR